MLPAVQKALRSIGLNEGEVSVLGVLLEGGPMLAARVAKKAALNRTTTYGLLKELVGKGLVTKETRRGADVFISIDPSLLPALVARRREELLAQEEALMEAIPQLTLLRQKATSLPSVRFFEGIEGVKQAYEDTLVNNRNKALYDITGTDAVYKKMGMEWLRYYWGKRSRLGIRCTVVAPDTQWSSVMKGEDKEYLRTTKVVSGLAAFEAEVDIYDDKVGFFSFSQENPIAVIIEDDTIQRTMKSIFDRLASI